jgi:phage gp45-like
MESLLRRVIDVGIGQVTVLESEQHIQRVLVAARGTDLEVVRDLELLDKRRHQVRGLKI